MNCVYFTYLQEDSDQWEVLESTAVGSGFLTWWGISWAIIVLSRTLHHRLDCRFRGRFLYPNVATKIKEFRKL